MSMPKLTRTTSHHRYSNPMPVSLAPSQHPMSQNGMAFYSNPRMPATDYYGNVATSAPQAPMAVPSQYDPYAVAPLTIPTSGPSSLTVPPPLPTQHRASSGAWNASDDHTLLTARAQGQNWAQIHQNYFPNKTPNACRKRHERLMERKGADDWDTRKMEKMAKEYMALRKEIWAPLALRTGEKWNVVEQKCMSNGLKNLQASARAAARRERLESGQPLAGYDDDSGISGIDLTPVDDIDGYGSPGNSTSSGGGQSSSSTASQSYSTAAPLQHHHHHHHHASQQGSYPGYGGYPQGPHHGYTSSVSSTGTAAAYQQQPHGQHSQSASPYMSHGNRLPSVDMGIDAIINRPGGAQHHQQQQQQGPM